MVGSFGSRLDRLEERDDDPAGRAVRLRRFVESGDTTGMSDREIELAQRWRAHLVDALAAVDGEPGAVLGWTDPGDDNEADDA